MKNYRNEEIDIQEFREVYKKDPLFRILIQFLASQQEDEEVLTVDGLVKRLGENGTLVEYNDARRMLQALDGRNVGWFLIGRRGQKSRFQFNTSSRELAQAVTEEPQVIELPEGAAKMITHRLWLRPDVEITFNLPFDLNEKEVARIGEFLKTLPFNRAGFKRAA